MGGMAYSASTPNVRTVLQSILHSGNQVLWCEVVSRGHHDYEMHVIPQSNMAQAVVESFERISDAVRRHAEVSWVLRESGWRQVIAHDASDVHPTAA